MSITLKVDCYSGYKAEERPRRFSFPAAAKESGTARSADVLRGRTHEVREVLDQWYGLGYQCFKVRAEDNNIYILRHHTEQDSWTLDAFRREGPHEGTA